MFEALPAPTARETALDQLLDRQALVRAKLGLLDEKLQLINFGMQGVTKFPEHRPRGRLRGHVPHRGTFRIHGYEILQADASASLTAGVGAKFDLAFESTLFGGSKFSVEAGTTLGVGSEAGTSLRFNASNLAMAMHSLFYSAYLELLQDKNAAHTY